LKGQNLIGEAELRCRNLVLNAVVVKNFASAAGLNLFDETLGSIGVARLRRQS
jgi:hypothetical protein